MASDTRADRYRKDRLCLKHWLLLTWASWGEISQLDSGISPSMEGRRNALEKARMCHRCTSSADAQVINPAMPAEADFGVLPTHARGDSDKSWLVVGVAISAVAAALFATLVLHSRTAPATAGTGIQVRHTTYVDLEEDVARLKVGDCLPRGIPFGNVWRVRIGPCHQPHRQQVYAVFRLAPGQSSGQKSVDRRGDADCRKRFKAFVGVTYEASEMDYYAVTPDVRDLSVPVVCVVVDGHRGTTTLKGARR
jgi:hypothetical protein